jgi:hypothetical protein
MVHHEERTIDPWDDEARTFFTLSLIPDLMG